MAGLEAFLGGGGAPPPDPMAGGAPPPGLEAFMGGGGAPPPEALPPEPPPEEGGGPVDEVTGYSQVIDSITSIMELETVTEQERAQMLKGVAIFQKLLADNEKMQQDAGANPALQKALVSG